MEFLFDRIFELKSGGSVSDLVNTVILLIILLNVQSLKTLWKQKNENHEVRIVDLEKFKRDHEEHCALVSKPIKT